MSNKMDLLNKEDIALVEAGYAMPFKSGVYFLVDDKELVTLTVRGMRYFQALIERFNVSFEYHNVKSVGDLWYLYAQVKAAVLTQVVSPVDGSSVSPQSKGWAESYLNGTLGEFSGALVSAASCIKAGPNVIPLPKKVTMQAVSLLNKSF